MSNLTGYGGSARSGLKDVRDYVTFVEDFIDNNVIDNGGKFSGTADQSSWYLTGDATMIAAGNDGARGGIVVFTTDGTADDYTQIQLNGEAFCLTKGKKTWFEISLACDDVDDMGFVVGLTQTSTTATELVAATTDIDMIGFQLDTAAEDGSIDAIVGTATVGLQLDTGVDLSDATLATYLAKRKVLAFEYDGAETIRFFVNGDEKVKVVDGETPSTTVLGTTVDIPFDLPLTITIGVQEEDAGAARSLWVDYVAVRMER